MHIVTLTTDFGWKDYYVGMLKGGILSHNIPVNLVDITHDIDNYNIAQAAFILKNCYKSFPRGTIHLLSVNNFYAAERRYLAILYQNHYFIGADNGIFSLLCDGAVPEWCYELPSLQADSVTDVKQIFVRAIGHLLQGKALQDIGTPSNRILQRIAIQPIIFKNQIRGTVIHIDNYENVILNIDKSLFERVGKGRPFELYFKRFDPITTVSRNYADVPEGDVLCLFNAAGFLEIAIHLDKAASLLGLNVDDAIQLDFLG